MFTLIRYTRVYERVNINMRVNNSKLSVEMNGRFIFSN